VIQTRNARIVSTQLGAAGSNVMSVWIHLDFGGSGQAFGGLSLDRYDPSTRTRVGTAFGCEFVRRVLEVLKVEDWEQLPGTPVRVRAEHEKVHAIGHFIEDRWFEPGKDLAFLLEKGGAS
jgi:hypothetical protein